MDKYTWNAWNKSPLANLKLSTAPCLVSSTAWARACTSTWYQKTTYRRALNLAIGVLYLTVAHVITTSMCHPVMKKKIKGMFINLTSSKGGASYKLSWGVAGESRSSRSNLSVRSEIGDKIPWRKQNPLCMLHNVQKQWWNNYINSTYKRQRVAKYPQSRTDRSWKITLLNILRSLKIVDHTHVNELLKQWTSLQQCQTFSFRTTETYIETQLISLYINVKYRNKLQMSLHFHVQQCKYRYIIVTKLVSSSNHLNIENLKK